MIELLTAKYNDVEIIISIKFKITISFLNDDIKC